MGGGFIIQKSKNQSATEPRPSKKVVVEKKFTINRVVRHFVPAVYQPTRTAYVGKVTELDDEEVHILFLEHCFFVISTVVKIIRLIHDYLRDRR